MNLNDVRKSARNGCRIMHKRLASGDGIHYCKLYLTGQLFFLFDLSDDEQMEIYDRMDVCKSYKECESLYRDVCKEQTLVEL